MQLKYSVLQYQKTVKEVTVDGWKVCMNYRRCVVESAADIRRCVHFAGSLSAFCWTRCERAADVSQVMKSTSYNFT